MTSKEKAAILRIVTDIIKADQVIDQREIDFYNVITQRISATHDHEILSAKISLAEAVEIVKSLRRSERERLFKACKDLTVSDGFCSKEETMLLLALEYCLINSPHSGSVISAEIDPKLLTDNQVLYVESTYNQSINMIIEQNLRTITKELKTCGLDFIYIPEIARHYRDASLQMVSDAVRILNPSISDNLTAVMVEKLRNIQTHTFCIEQLDHKLNMSEMLTVAPSLLMYIGTSIVNERFVTNYLCLGLSENVMSDVCSLCDRILSIINTDNINISLRVDEPNKFMYRGFFQEIFDLIALKRSVTSDIIVDFDEGTFIFNGIDEQISGLNRKEKALYILFIYEMRNGGVRFTLPATPSEKLDYNQRMDRLQKRYAHIYHYFNGDGCRVPDILCDEIRRPILSHIKTSIKNFTTKIFEAEKFIVARNTNGIYSIWTNPDRFRYYSHIRQAIIDITESELFKALDKI